MNPIPLFLTGTEFGAAVWPHTPSSEDRPPVIQLGGRDVFRVSDLQNWLNSHPPIEASFQWPSRVTMICPQLEIPHARPLDISLTQSQFEAAMAAANGVAANLRPVLSELAIRSAATRR